MFDNKRYMTRGINENVDIWIQIVLWNMVDTLSRKLGDKTDYLQVFELNADGEKLRITQRQEQPEYKTVRVITMPENNIKGSMKIYAIDSGTYSIMLILGEY